MQAIKTHRELRVFQNAVAAALHASRIAARFPPNERALQDQYRRAARAPGAAIAEAWPRRRYRAYWTNKLSEAQSEAAETQYWAEIAWKDGYCSEEEFTAVFAEFETVIGQLGSMISKPSQWVPAPPKKTAKKQSP